MAGRKAKQGRRWAPPVPSKAAKAARDPEALARAASLHQSGRLSEAEAAYRLILRAQPAHPDALHLLGVLHYQHGRSDAAAELIGKAVALAPGVPSYHSNLGLALMGLGRAEEAVGHYRRALAVRPDDPVYHSNLGMALRALGQPEEAIASYERALALGLNSAEVHSNLGNALCEAGRKVAAEESCRRALALNPNLPEAHNNLGNALRDQGQFTAAEAHYRRAVELKPAYADAHCSLGGVLWVQGRLPEAVAGYRRALELGPGSPAAHSNLLLALQYHPGCTRSDLFTEACAWGERYAAPLAGEARPHPNAPDPERRLRVGYVSPDLRRHPVGYFLEPLLAHHDGRAVEVFCYSTNSVEDELTARLRRGANHWRSLFGVDDAAAAERVREDRIDILVDLSGHTGGNRLLLFARKPAPVQVTWLGYPDTTGVPAIDCLLGDWHICPEGDDRFYTERVVRLPHSYLCCSPPEGAPDVAPPPALSRGCVTFGCLNNLSKVTEEVIALWGEILRAVPDSRLFLKTAALDDPGVRQRVAGLFASQGIESGRLEMAGKTSRSEHLAAYHQVDIGLDPFPFNGGTTTMEALWMGVPVVTLAGDRYVSRVGASQLRVAGLEELVAGTPEEYAAIATALAGRVGRLAELRAGLRDRLLASPLCDASRYARGVEAAYREMWARWCRGDRPESHSHACPSMPAGSARDS